VLVVAPWALGQYTGLIPLVETPPKEPMHVQLRQLQLWILDSSGRLFQLTPVFANVNYSLVIIDQQNILVVKDAFFQLEMFNSFV